MPTMRTIFAVAVALLALASCTAQQPAPASAVPSAAVLKVAASFYPLAFFAEQVGKDLTDVTQITPGGVEPHDYDPSPQQLATVQDARVFIMNGAGADAWGDKVIDGLKRNGAVTLRMTDVIKPMGGFNEEGNADPLKPSAANANAYDPHIWLDPVLAKKEIALIRDAFIQADPAHAVQYARNANDVTGQLSSLDREFRRGLQHCAVKDAVVSHNAFRYMAQEYGFSTLAVAGLDPEQEPSPERIAQLADFGKKNGIKYIFFETLASPKIAEALADEIGAQSLVLNPIEGLTENEEKNGDNYLTLMRQNLQNLRTAMQCR